MIKSAFLLVCCGVLWAAPLRAHVGEHPSVHDTVQGILERMKKELPMDELRNLTPAKAEAFLNEHEREILGSEHISFRVNVPVTVSVVRPAEDAPPYWLKERGFTRRDLDWEESDKKLEVWEKAFPAGWVGLGVNSLRGGGSHYLLLLEPREAGSEVRITDLYPGQLRVAQAENGARFYVDRDGEFENLPAPFAGSTIIQTQYGRRDDARLLELFRFTDHPATDIPDHIVLTWSDDPQTTQTIQWRTSPEVERGAVIYQKKAAINPLLDRQPISLRVEAETRPLVQPELLNDPVNHRHTAVLRDLEPGTTYIYSVGDGSEAGWSEPSQFTTAPADVEPFSFIYMGDAQNGLYRWGTLLKNAFRDRPDAAFYIMAGDLVNRGADRADWDRFFHNAAGVYDQRQLVPAIGNHENQGGHPGMYLDLFTLRENGPSAVEKERAYSFEYSNALFIILDTNLDPASQAAWLDQQLSGSDATWKFVVYHHPAYSSAPRRDNREVRELWTPIFDKYHVDLALQGHDHAYLRTFPMHDEKRVESAAEGTIYIVSVSGTKMYDQDQRDYTEFGMTNVSTYQVLDIQIEGDRLVYRAYDIDGKLRDEFVIEK